jgi:hemerythrin-like domain-containing protein
MAAERTFQAFAEAHRRFDRALVDHQVALTELDLRRAAALLERLDGEVRAHARWEDRELLPVYEARAEPTRIGAAGIFRSEHAKIAAHLDALRGRMGSLRRDDPELRRRVVEMIDEERLFKELLRHHAEREEKTLYPALDRLCSAEERRRMVEAAPPG